MIGTVSTYLFCFQARLASALVTCAAEIIAPCLKLRSMSLDIFTSLGNTETTSKWNEGALSHLYKIFKRPYSLYQQISQTTKHFLLQNAWSEFLSASFSKARASTDHFFFCVSGLP